GAVAGPAVVVIVSSIARMIARAPSLNFNRVSCRAGETANLRDFPQPNSATGGDERESALTAESGRARTPVERGWRATCGAGQQRLLALNRDSAIAKSTAKSGGEWGLTGTKTLFAAITY